MIHPLLRSRRVPGGHSKQIKSFPSRIYTKQNLDKIPQLRQLPDEQQFAIRVVAQVLPFRVNQYVIDRLIQWEDVPDDPMFRLVFPQREMLAPEHFSRVADLLRAGADKAAIKVAAQEIHRDLNPHPAGQMTHNLPRVGNECLAGAQHKYRETLLFFPSQGQTCHSYCSFCFRWAQFTENKDLRISSRETATLHEYLQSHSEENHAAARDCLEKVLVEDPDYAVGMGWLAYLYADEFHHRWNERPEQYDARDAVWLR